VYDFVADRLRAVRKDLIIQGLHDLDVLPVLEPMVIFHVYSGYRCVKINTVLYYSIFVFKIIKIYRLCECKPAVFDAKLNDDMLTDCLRRVLDIYDSHSNTSSELMDSIFALHFIHGSEGILRLISLHSYKG
jgi:SAC3/GANP family